MTAPVLRPATPADAEALATLAVATFHDGWANIIGQEAARQYAAHHLTPERLRAEIADKAAHDYLLATGGDTLLGYAKLDLLRAAHESVRGAYPVLLQRLYLAASAHGTGLADTLLTGIEAEATRHDRQTLWLECDPRNVRAWRFYEKRGFATRAQVAYILPGGQNDEVRVMERAIADTSTPEAVRSTNPLLRRDNSS